MIWRVRQLASVANEARSCGRADIVAFVCYVLDFAEGVESGGTPVWSTKAWSSAQKHWRDEVEVALNDARHNPERRMDIAEAIAIRSLVRAIAALRAHGIRSFDEALGQ
jgi:hypothetical protein